jgi:hypothetical protein
MADLTGNEAPVLHKELLDQPLPQINNPFSFAPGLGGLFNLNFPPIQQ